LSSVGVQIHMTTILPPELCEQSSSVCYGVQEVLVCLCYHGGHQLHTNCSHATTVQPMHLQKNVTKVS